jgi:hypothetical protein
MELDAVYVGLGSEADFHHYFHTDLETPQTVRWTGLEASTRAYATIIDEVEQAAAEHVPAP